MVVDHNQVYDIFSSMRSKNIVASYIGIFDRNILITLGKNFKSTLLDDLTQAKRFFKIFIELASNIAYYSREKNDQSQGIGTIIIKENQGKFEITAGNLVNINDKEKLSSKIDLINYLEREDLRKLKRKFLNEPSEKNNGNIGLVQIALVSHYPLKYKFFDLGNNEFFFLLTITLDKNFKKTNQN